MSDSEFLSKAKLQIESVRGHSLSSDERRQAAITLAAFLMQEAKKNQTPDEIAQLTLLQKMMESKDGKTFATAIVDQCLRPKNPRRAADQLIFLIRKYGVPEYLPSLQRFLMRAAKIFGRWLPSITISEANKAIRQQTIHVILPAEPKSLKSHYDRRHSQGIKLNLNYLGEAILGEEEARERFELYTNYLKEPFIDYISIKISTLYSQINLYAEDETLAILADRFRALLTTAKEEGNKFINLDMEEYRDLHLTIKLFKSVLSEESFMGMSAGIVLQAYLPDTFNILKELTNWAMDRVKRGGNSIKIRVVKGANRSMEMVEASLKNWPLPTYDTKTSTDANFKRMISFALNPEHVKAVRIGIGSHNIFDIAYAILLSAENNVDEGVDFEMLEGMAPSLTRAIKQLTGRALLYCPVTTAKDFHFAVAYLMRRLDENTSRNNFLRNFFGLVPGQKEWQNQATLFSMGCEEIELASDEPRKQQDRRIAPKDIPEYSSFENEPDTDFSLAHNIEWGVSIRNSWIKKTFIPIPKILAGIKQEIEKEEKSVKALLSLCDLRVFHLTHSTMS